MARAARSAATDRAYLQFAPPPAHGVVAAAGPADEFDESDVWGAFTPAAAPDPRAAAPPFSPRTSVVPKAARKARPPAEAAHGSLPVNIPDWSKILGGEYQDRHGDWEVEDADDDAVVPPHELAWRRRAASLSVHQGAGVVGRTLKVRDAVWRTTTGFQD